MRARRDLRRINGWMLQPGIMARLLRRQCASPPRVIMDLGAGDGTFMLRVARRLAPRWRDVTIALLDRQDVVSRRTRESFARIGWKAEPIVGAVY